MYANMITRYSRSASGWPNSTCRTSHADLRNRPQIARPHRKGGGDGGGDGGADLAYSSSSDPADDRIGLASSTHKIKPDPGPLALRAPNTTTPCYNLQPPVRESAAALYEKGGHLRGLPGNSNSGCVEKRDWTTKRNLSKSGNDVITSYLPPPPQSA
ncbi:hypothetical protein SODALDRAFT_377061 [Sodiomyces alkalinus F11]|uniref:Uncharacterized protein n=1 Tax=Sodiomyces alkalinus (strain CBS 110278 / VKM F-3762 / F11) TaxID=1314773 RepID=A0A3N2Q3P9_SODAK|nr:hypothetical protein SODALDRAFT_377061 [Sodiomyces alkalinus F11]ROT41383.1 hypothetical protein SODALDRAFT_377061 [Sodiomyces alkalinus F11]